MAKALAKGAKDADKKPPTAAERRTQLLAAGAKDPQALSLMAPVGVTDDALAMAMDSVDGTTDNAVTAWGWGKQSRKGAELSVTHCAEVLRDEIAKVQSGDLSQVDAMLYGQAKALAAVFHGCLSRAGQNLGQNLGATDTYMRIALKAQSQCRTTLEALIESKQPRSVAFVKQANIANGHQQVNNGDARTNSANPPNELQGDFHVVDDGTEAARVRTDAPAATMAQVNGAANGRRKVTIKPKRMAGRRKANAPRPRKSP